MNLNLFIIDSISPFFISSSIETTNWSKIPYHLLEKNGSLRKKYQKKIERNFVDYIRKVIV